MCMIGDYPDGATNDRNASYNQHSCDMECDTCSDCDDCDEWFTCAHCGIRSYTGFRIYNDDGVALCSYCAEEDEIYA